MERKQIKYYRKRNFGKLYIHLVYMIIILLLTNNINCSNHTLEQSILLKQQVDTLSEEMFVQKWQDITNPIVDKYSKYFAVKKQELRDIITTLVILETSAKTKYGHYAPLKSNSSFDEYLDYSQSVKDWFNHLKTTYTNDSIGRYKSVYTAENPYEFFYELQNCGYATDKEFSYKCMKIYKRITNQNE